jgi:hypothetical protein
MKDLGRTLPFVFGLYLVLWGLGKLLMIAAPSLARVHPVLGQASVTLSQ